ncbi:MAG: DUF805 domain-containing protein [Butyricicoccus pullicaecorum]|nr:DUF805 domain-containing protein [Butyricicoccus pullicaecorum]
MIRSIEGEYQTMETNPIRAFAEMWTHTFDFSGRTRRTSYWGAVVVNFLVTFLLDFIPYANIVYMVVSILPGIAMSVRRLHDINWSGWWLLVALIPFGGIFVLVLLLMDSTGANRFGDSPKYGKVPF